MRDSGVFKNENKTEWLYTYQKKPLSTPKHIEATGKTSDRFLGSFDASLCISAACGAKL